MLLTVLSHALLPHLSHIKTFLIKDNKLQILLLQLVLRNAVPEAAHSLCLAHQQTWAPVLFSVTLQSFDL